MLATYKPRILKSIDMGLIVGSFQLIWNTLFLR